MKRFWPLVLIMIGLSLLLGGFIYDVLFAGIPYQDPTPEMAARYADHAQIAATIRCLGAGISFVGGLAGIIQLVRFVKNRTRESS